MKIKIYMSSIAALAGMTTAEAREAALTQFSTLAERSEPIGARQAAITENLRVHLEGLAQTTDRAEKPQTSIYLEQTWQGGAPVPCAATGYSETWWLPRAVEVRRAAQAAIIAAIACESGLPTNLLDAVIAQESGYRSWAISRAGAMGMMQVMPGTARALGLSTPFEPIANMRAGAHYLRQQIDRFGRIDLALAAYNAGPERRSLRAGYIPAIPETQHYVRTILTNWARLIELNAGRTQAPDRGELAMTAVRASGYREVELIRYEGPNALNPM